MNSKRELESLTRRDFTSKTVVVGIDARLTFELGNPTEENYQKFLNSEISEEELREMSSNTYYIAIPKKYVGTFKILGGNTIADLTDSFEKVSSTLFTGCDLYQSVNNAYFNIDYPEGNVKQEFVLTF